MMAEEAKKVRANDLLGEAEFYPLPAGWTSEGGYILIKCRDEEGQLTWSYRATSSLSPEELLGALTVQAALHKSRLVAEFDDDE
jgi:hypothetical protein